VMGPGGALEGARRAQDEGLVRHVGITIHRALPVMRAAIESGEFATLMVAYCPPDPEGVGAEIIPAAAERGMGVIVMKPLNGGALSLPEEVRPEEGDPIARDSLRFVLGHRGVTCAIPGMRAVREVRENCTVGERFEPLTEAEERALFERVAPLAGRFRYDQFCLRCGYCQPCPNDVPIPEIFRALMMVRSYPANLRHLGTELYASLPVTPEACTECRECVEKCPAGLDIPARLREAAAEFGGTASSSVPA